MRHLRLLVALSVLAGLAAGTVAALAVPRHTTPSDAPPRVDVRRVAAPVAHDTSQLDVTVDGHGARVLTTVPDPAGGPAWAIRGYSGAYVLPKDVPRSHVGREMLGAHACVELGRIVDGRFGWLDGAGTFRPAAPGRAYPPRLCHQLGTRQDAGDAASLTTWVSHPDFGEPRPLATVVWGAAPAGDRDVTVTSDGRPRAVHAGDGGAFLAFLPAAGAAPSDLRVTARDVAGAVHRLYRPFALPARLGIPKTGRGILMARATDPAGGASWGVAAARAQDGRWCSTNPGRVVGDGVGQLDERLDLFYDQSRQTYACPLPANDPRWRRIKVRPLSRRQPLMYGSTSGAPPTSARPGDTPGRIALRTDPGATVYAGTTRADVASITVIAPTQTRTIRPAGAAHAFVIAFAGSFPSGRIRFVVTFRDGRTVEQDDRADDLA